MKVFASIVIAVVAILIGVGLYASGSPANARLEREDTLREEHLEQIAYALDNYVSQGETELPENLADIHGQYLRPGIVDPATGEVYEYRKISDEQYELCATFAAVSSLKDQRTPRYALDEPWIMFQEHDAGRVCFERVVDNRYYR